MIQTALVLSHRMSEADLGGAGRAHPVWSHPHLSVHYLRYDGRLRPAYYIMTVAALSLFTMTVVVPRCRKHIQSLSILEAAAAAVRKAKHDHKARMHHRADQTMEREQNKERDGIIHTIGIPIPLHGAGGDGSGKMLYKELPLTNETNVGVDVEAPNEVHVDSIRI
jgi:hypothetical protein